MDGETNGGQEATGNVQFLAHFVAHFDSGIASR